MAIDSKSSDLYVQVFLVAGGYAGGGNAGYLDSTELYDPSVGSWVVAAAKLPTPMRAFNGVNIDNRVLFFGNYSV